MRWLLKWRWSWLFRRRSFKQEVPKFEMTCPVCKEDLAQTKKYFYVDDDELYRYGCSCGAESVWDLEALVPLLVENTL